MKTKFKESAFLAGLKASRQNAIIALAAVTFFLGSSPLAWSVPATFVDIQNAIDNATPGEVINVDAGTVTLAQTEVITIPTDKLGIKLIGAGVGNTILEKAAGGTSQSIMFIGENSPPPPPAAAATLIDGFTFKNSDLAARGLHIRASGVSPGDPAIVRNCDFLDFEDTGIAIGDFTLAHWEFSGNSFDGSRLAIWINSADFVTIRDNVFQDYVVAVGFDSDDIVTDLAIIGNQLLGGRFGLWVSSASTIAGGSKNWDISSNTITEHTDVGIRVNAPTSGVPSQSLTDVVVRDNCIYGNALGIDNQSSELVDAEDNWWGDASGPFHPTSNPAGLGDEVSDGVDFDPWFITPASPCAPPDSDGDGVPDADDGCPDTDLSPTVIIDGCDSGVPNTLFADGCTISDLIAEAAVGAKNHGQFVRSVSHLTNGLKKDGLITGRQKGAIQSCAAKAK